MNEDDPNLPPLGSGLQYLKRKKPSFTRPQAARNREPHPKEEAQEDDRASKNEIHELLMSLSSHLSSNNFTIQRIDVHMAEELKRKKAEEEVMHEVEMSEEYKALNEALIELTRTHVDQTQIEIETRSSVWNLNTQLYQHGRARKYISLFSEVVSYPVHSAITDDENVEWFLRSGESFAYPSPLAFNISLAICIGANHLQDKATSEEFFWQARDQVAGLMDQTDYHVANGLMVMAYVCSSLSMPQQATYYATLGVSICEQLGNLKNPVYPRLVTLALLSPTYSASDLRKYYNKMVRAKDTPQQIPPAPAPPHSHSFPSASASPPTLASTTTSMIPAVPIINDSLAEGLACLLLDIIVDMTLLMALTASTDNPNELEYQYRYLARLSERWEQARHLFKRSQRLTFDLLLCTVEVSLGMRAEDYTSAETAAFKFFDLMDHPIFMYMALFPAFVAPILEYFEKMQDAEHLSYFLSRLRQVNNASFLNAPSLSNIMERIKPLLNSLPGHI